MDFDAGSNGFYLMAEGFILAFIAILLLRHSSSKAAHIAFVLLYAALVVYYLSTFTVLETFTEELVHPFYIGVSILGAPLALICSVMGMSSARMLKQKTLEYVHVSACILSVSFIVFIFVN